MIYEFEKQYEDFNQFCMYIKTPEDLMKWLIYNKVIWDRTGNESIDPNDYPFSFPDDIIKHKTGICYDIALFVYYFCKRQNIPCRIARIAIYLKLKDSSEYWCWGHITSFYKYNGRFYAFQYSENEKDSKIEGPYSSWDNAIEEYSKSFYDIYYAYIAKHYKVSDIKGPYKGYVKYEGYKYFDLIYNNHNITQNQFNEMFPDAYVKFELDR